MKHLTWRSHSSAIWEMAHKLQEDGIQVDVYLHTAAAAADDMMSQDNTAAPRPPHRKKKLLKDFISFPAHRLILAAASPFLRKVLSEHYHEHHDACVNITIPHVLPDALHCILNFLYSGSISVSSGIRDNVLEAASLLQINDFTDYYSSSIKVERLFKADDITSEQKVPKVKTAEIPHTRNESKIKRLSGEERASSHVSKGAVRFKKEAGTQQGDGGGSGAGRRHRKVKSKYSSDIYEVNLPKMRKWKRKKLHKILKTKKKCSAEIQQCDVSQRPQKHMMHSITEERDEKSDLKELSRNEETLKGLEVVTSDSHPASQPPPYTDASLFTGKGNKSQASQYPIALASSSSSSFLLPPLYVPEQSYFSDSATKPKTPSDVSYPSTIMQEDSEVMSERQLETATITIGLQSPPPPPPLLSEVKELPIMSPPSSLSSFPLKQVTSLTHDHKISDPFHEDKSEAEEQEDGLFKFQVLLKECEDFPDEVCPVPHSAQESREDSSVGKCQPGEGSVDINQWIAEEIHSCIIPTGSSQCDVSTEDVTKKNAAELSTMDIKTSDSSADKNKSEVECEQCGKKFSDHRSCQSHIRGVHDEAKQMCRYCGKMFRRRCDLYQHERRHRTATLPCKYCGKIFKLAKDLQAHIVTHVGGKRFLCSHCNKELSSYRNLRNHIASIHQKERPFTCQECKRTFSKACSLQVHMRSVHTGERPFKCIVCDKTFCNAALLKNHQAVHTGEKKYSCRVCGRPFSQYSNMISHQRVHTNNRPFLCLICQEDFKTKEGLLKHKWLHTGLKPLRCRHCCREFRIKERYERHMLKCHNEVVSLPEIYFEAPDEMVTEEEGSSSPHCDIKVIGTIGKEEHFEDRTHDHILDEGSPDDLGPVVHLVNNIGEQEVADVETGHVQLSYPILTTAAGLREANNITLGNITGQISYSGHVESIDVESLLNSEDSPNNDSLIITGEEKNEMIPTTIHDSTVRNCKEVVIVTKVSEDTDGLSEEMHSQSTIKIWIPSERTELEQQDVEGDTRGDILIVSNQTFAETSHTGQVLDPEMTPQAVHTMILEGSDCSL